MSLDSRQQSTVECGMGKNDLLQLFYLYFLVIIFYLRHHRNFEALEGAICSYKDFISNLADEDLEMSEIQVRVDDLYLKPNTKSVTQNNIYDIQ